jgi:hypothetical protein
VDNSTVADLSLLKEKYVQDGIKVSERLVQEGNVRAVWLSGPLDIRRVQPESDLHVCVLAEKGRHNFFRHVLPAFSDTGRRLEIAVFPQAYIESILERGHGCWTDVYDLHKFNDAVVLFDREHVLGDLRKRIAELKPADLFIGQQIAALGARVRAMQRARERGGHDESLIVARDVVHECTRLLTLIVGRQPFSKSTYLHTALPSLVSPQYIEVFQRIHSLIECDRSSTEFRVNTARHLVQNLFEQVVLCDVVSD